MKERMEKKPRVINHREARLQSECVIWYRNEWYRNPRNLWATFNEGRDVNTKFSLGLTPYVPDLLYFEPWGRGLVGIEMKFPGEVHEVSRLIGQAKWMLEVSSVGYFCDSLEMFKTIIEGGRGILPLQVLDYCNKLTSKSLTWNNELFK